MMGAYYSDDHCVIYHGDCREIVPTLGAFDAVITDPPYGIDHDADYTRFTKGANVARSTHERIAGDTEPFDPSWLASAAPRLVLFGANCFSDRLPVGSWLVWDKRSPGGSKNVMSDAEVAWLNHGHGVYIFEHAWDGFNRASERGTAHHPNQKPVALMRWVVGRWTQPADRILDPYMGSGPVARACMDLRRRYVGVELNERYCEIAAKRLAQEVLDFGAA